MDSAGPSLVRISPDTNERVEAIPVGNGPVGVAVGLGAVWVTNGIDGTVSWINPETNEVSETIRVGDGPTGIAAYEGGVGVTNSNSGTLVRIDGSANTVVKSVNVGNHPGPVATGSDDVWVGNTLDGRVTRIEPSAGSVTETIGVGLHPSAIALAGDSVWVTNEFGGTVSRVRCVVKLSGGSRFSTGGRSQSSAIVDILFRNPGRTAPEWSAGKIHSGAAFPLRPSGLGGWHVDGADVLRGPRIEYNRYPLESR